MRPAPLIWEHAATHFSGEWRVRVYFDDSLPTPGFAKRRKGSGWYEIVLRPTTQALTLPVSGEEIEGSWARVFVALHEFMHIKLGHIPHPNNKRERKPITDPETLELVEAVFQADQREASLLAELEFWRLKRLAAGKSDLDAEGILGLVI